MRSIVTDDEAINELGIYARTYDGLNKFIVTIKNRLHSLNPEANPRHDWILGGEGNQKGLKSIKDKLSREIKKCVEIWPIWTEYLANVPGIGPAIASNLILFYYYRFTPICEKCGEPLPKKTFTCEKCNTKAKGLGNLKYRIEIKDFKNISSWWHYMGVHCITMPDGKNRKPKLRKGITCDWNSKGRTLAFHIGEQFIKQKPGHKYRDFYDRRKARRLQTHPDASKVHRHNMARNETAKLFLAHFWTVTRVLESLPVTEPYAGTILGHTGIIEPFYFDIEEYKERLEAA